MDTKQAIDMLKRLVNWAESSVEQRRIDFNMVAADQRPQYEAAMKVVTDAIKAGELTRDDFIARVGIK